MLKQIFSSIANIFLVFIPFVPVLENIFPNIDYGNFSSYLIACSIIATLMLFLTLVLYSQKTRQRRFLWPTWLFFVVGVIVMVPLHMGLPKESEALLQAVTVEKTRYILLLLATLVFAVGVLLTLRLIWTGLTKTVMLMIALLSIACLISIWDHYDSMMFSDKLRIWINNGNTAATFFPNYDFHEVWRTIGRMLLYVIVAWLSVILFHCRMIKKWQVITLALFCLIGTGFCFVFLINGPAFYFPFMVPAIAFAPSYWLGLCLINATVMQAKT